MTNCKICGSQTENRVYCSIVCRNRGNNRFISTKTMEQKKSKMSNYMIMNNPMKNKDVVNKVRNTWKQKMNAGYVSPNVNTKRPDFSEYLIKNNPMRNDKIKNQALEKSRKNCKRISKPQLNLFNKVKNNFPDTELEYFITFEKKVMFLDIAIPSLLVNVEYDGKYWHKNSIDKDEVRDNLLERNGWSVIRIGKDTKNISSLLDFIEFKRKIAIVENT